MTDIDLYDRILRAMLKHGHSMSIEQIGSEAGGDEDWRSDGRIERACYRLTAEGYLDVGVRTHRSHYIIYSLTAHGRATALNK